MKKWFYEILIYVLIILDILAIFWKDKFDNEKFFLLSIILCFLIFVLLLLKYSSDKRLEEQKFAEKVFGIKKEDINSDIVSLIRNILNRKDK